MGIFVSKLVSAPLDRRSKRITCGQLNTDSRLSRPALERHVRAFSDADDAYYQSTFGFALSRPRRGRFHRALLATRRAIPICT
jgi:hypothetical protein